MGQDLDGVLPPSLVKLPYHKELYVSDFIALISSICFSFLDLIIASTLLLVGSNLMQNYLSGSIPPEWGSTKLDFL